MGQFFTSGGQSIGVSASASVLPILNFIYIYSGAGASLVVQLVKNLPAVLETWVQSLGWEHPLEKGKYSGLENSMDYTVHGIL